MKKIVYNVLATIFNKKRNLPFSEQSIVYPALITPFVFLAIFSFWILTKYNIEYQELIMSVIGIPLFFFSANKLTLCLINLIVKARKLADKKYSLLKAFSFLLIFYILCFLPIIIAFLYYVSTNATALKTALEAYPNVRSSVEYVLY